MAPGFRRSRGLSLLEALVAIALVGVLLGSVASLWEDYAAVVRHVQEEDAVIAAAYTGLQVVSTELAGAIVVSQPPIGTTDPSLELVFQKIDPGNATRLPLTLPNPLPATWKPLDDAFRVEVRYTAEDGRLLRYVRPLRSGGVETSSPVASGITGFTTTRIPGGGFMLSTSFLRKGQVRTLSTTVRSKRT